MPNPKDWTTVGTENEASITLEDYMTYDEIAISALIGVSVPTFFINPGGRYNGGNPDDPKQDYGIYIALTGARFEKREKMESQHILVTPLYHTKELGYGSTADPEHPLTKLLEVWAKFYEEENEDTVTKKKRFFFLSYEELDELWKKDDENIKKKFHHHQPNTYTPALYINVPKYKFRLQLSIEPFLLEANARAHLEHKPAYIHAVGLGLGVWQISNEQALWMLEVYAEVIKKNNLAGVSDIDFSWFPDSALWCGQNREEGVALTITDVSNHHTINIHFSKRDPAEKLKDDKKLLVAMYAWDGNSFPGNEYWRGMLHASGDPAAACCSTIAELQNPYVNKDFVHRIIEY